MLGEFGSAFADRLKPFSFDVSIRQINARPDPLRRIFWWVLLSSRTFIPPSLHLVESILNSQFSFSILILLGGSYSGSPDRSTSPLRDMN